MIVFQFEWEAEKFYRVSITIPESETPNQEILSTNQLNNSHEWDSLPFPLL